MRSCSRASASWCSTMGEVNWGVGDVVIQVGAFHQWSSPGKRGIVVFDMIAARFVDGPVGLAQGKDPVMQAKKLPQGVKPARRIVTIDREPAKSSLVADGRRLTCASIRRGPDSYHRGCGLRIATRRKSSSRRCICPIPLSLPREGRC